MIDQLTTLPLQPQQETTNTSKPIVSIPENTPFSETPATLAFFKGRNDGKIGMNSSPPDDPYLKEEYLKGFAEGQKVREKLNPEEALWIIGWRMGYNKQNAPPNAEMKTEKWKDGLDAGKKARKIMLLESAIKRRKTT